MWLKIEFGDSPIEFEGFKPNSISLKVALDKAAPIDDGDRSIRVSRIFPLAAEDSVKRPDVSNSEIRFYDFDAPFRVLGQLSEKGSEPLKESIFFSYGACSVILIYKDDKVLEEFKSIVSIKPRATEHWTVKNSLIQNIVPAASPDVKVEVPQILKYEGLPSLIMATLDEFCLSVHILHTKIIKEDLINTSILENLISIVNGFIKQLAYLDSLTGKIPDENYVENPALLSDPMENQVQRQQLVDRIIQINSAMSYVSTQSFSGSIPILERRSVIRRSSLLGIGSAMRGLNRIVDYIENAFNSVNFQEIITVTMHKSSSLPGLTNYAVPERNDWFHHNIDTFGCELEVECIKKLAYFSSRYGYRESEYAITAALNSVSHGVSLEWPLLTITHEMLHSHVRTVIYSVFYLESGTELENYLQFYTRFVNRCEGKMSASEPYWLIDSVRECIFTYCVRTISLGSITDEVEYTTLIKTNGAELYLPEFTDFYHQFQDEHRNISEIFVHVLDLHYFYGGVVGKYIPLIWRSWAAVPHIAADLRQYILRSLIAISSTINENPYERWLISIAQFRSALSQSSETMKIPLISQVMNVLADQIHLDKFYFGAFKNSLIVADLAKEIFFSQSVRAKLWDDVNITSKQNEITTETEFQYEAPEMFADIEIACPVPFLYDRMIRIINDESLVKDVERSTAITILALSSN